MLAYNNRTHYIVKQTISKYILLHQIFIAFHSNAHIRKYFETSK